MQVRWVALLALVHTSVGSIIPVATQDSVATTTAVGGLTARSVVHSKNGTARDARRRSKKSRSTSSSSGERFRDKSVDSLGIEESDTDTSSSEEKTSEKISRPRGQGWRKWHRTCQPCPDEMVKKWRDPTIKWICGGYQRARRSFKSECMMYYRNCQDGTMFVKLHDHRCDETVAGWNHGRHFFYDYRVRLLEESSDSQESSGESESSVSSDDSTSRSSKESSSNDKK